MISSTLAPQKIETVTIESCRLNLGQLDRLNDFGFYHPVFTCVTDDNERISARMRLHITEPLTPLVIADPWAFSDGGFEANSAGSPLLPRRNGYGDDCASSMSLPENIRFFEIHADQI